MFKWPTSLRSLIIANHAQTQRRLDMISAQVQADLDKVTQLVTIEQAVVAGLAVQNGQIATLNQTIAALQAQIAAGTPIGADDIAALATMGEDLDTVNSALTTAIPANVSAPAAAASSAASAAAVSGDSSHPSGQI